MEITEKCPVCGVYGVKARPYCTYTARYRKRDGKFLYCIECPKCKEHTLHGKTWDEAIDNWNNHRYSPETIMLRKPMDADTMNTKGAVKLAEKLMAEVHDDYYDTIKALMSGSYIKGILEVDAREKAALIAHAGTCERYYEETKLLHFTGTDAKNVINSIRREVERDLNAEEE
jgi:hypothetical protein